MTDRSNRPGDRCLARHDQPRLKRVARTKSRPWRRVSRRPAASATGRESSYISTTGESANSTEPATASPAIAPGKATAAASVGIRHLANHDRSRLAYWTSPRRESALVCVFSSTPLFLQGVKPWTCASLPLTPHLRNKTNARRTAGGCGSAHNISVQEHQISVPRFPC